MMREEEPTNAVILKLAKAMDGVHPADHHALQLLEQVHSYLHYLLLHNNI